MATMSVERTKDDWRKLCETVKDFVPSRIGDDAWELVIAAALITSPQPQILGEFYTYLSHHDPGYRSEEAKKRLSLRFRDTLLKLVMLVGAPQVVSALIPLAKAEGEPEQKANTSSLDPKWQNIDVSLIHNRGVHTIDTIYGALLPNILQGWGDHMQDVQFNLVFGVYGLYLSDTAVMTALETEAVVFTTISCTGLNGPASWHMRGMGRLLGARGTDEETQEMRQIKDMLRDLKQAMMTVVEWVGEEYVRRADLSNWANVGDVVRDLGGWGDDGHK